MIELGIKPDEGYQKSLDLLKSISDNAQRAANAVAYDAAMRYRADVEQRLRDAGSRHAFLLDSLSLKKYELGAEDMYLVISKAKVVRESEIEKELTAVWVDPKLQERWLFLLAQESPWPYTMLPVKPRVAEANLIGRRITQGEMERLRADKKTRLENVLSQLRAYGIDSTIGTAEVEVEIVIDTAWEAVRAEFGLDGFRRVPIWQPALKDILRDRKHLIETMEKALTKPTQPKHIDEEATAAEVSAIQKFQDKIKV